MIANILSVAGVDPSGGAGLLADMKTIAAFGCYGMGVVTALTAQNTRGVVGVQAAPAQFVKDQLDAIFSDIRVDAVKIGMLAETAVVEAVADRLSYWRPRIVVVDPVIAASTGDALASAGLVESVRQLLLPLTTIVTPNFPEAGIFAQRPAPLSLADGEDVARQFLSWGAGAVLLKGGHGEGAQAQDLLLSSSERRVFSAERIDASNTHGTGCALSSAIACALACGETLPDAAEKAKLFVWRAIAAASNLSVGRGSGPIDHGWRCRTA